MALAHRILADSEYKKYYQNLDRLRSWTMIDNGACELGISIPSEKLFKAALQINASVIVLPDKLNDASTTLSLISEFIHEYKDRLNNFKLMAVVQGTSRNEWLSCYKEYMNNPDINIIGISNTEAIFSNQKYSFNRVKTIEWLVKNNLVLKDKPIHLLGLPGSGHLELKKLNKFNFIEGVDTNAPVVHGFNGIKFLNSKKYNKIPYYLDNHIEISNDQLNLIKFNIDQLNIAAKYDPSTRR
jgi:hypothetical protein